jgi:RNA polymerase sigma-70 factor (ECF subfamily)
MSNQPDISRVDPVQEKREMFIQVYEKYRPSIFNYIFYRVGDTDLADDLTSDVFVRLVDKYDEEAREGRPITPWLYAIARNLIVDHQRRAGRIGWQPLNEQAAADESSNPLKQTESRLTQECLMGAMDDLTEDQKQVILLKFIEKRTNREIGDLLGKPEGAIKSLQHRALAGLRRALEKEPCYEA